MQSDMEPLDNIIQSSFVALNILCVLPKK
jgi:hypothetical protein